MDFTKGDILQADTDAIVNTVNCVGFMGRGIAAQFKRAFPVQADTYSRVITGDPGNLAHEMTHAKGGQTAAQNQQTADEYHQNAKTEEQEARDNQDTVAAELNGNCRVCIGDGDGPVFATPMPYLD